jgi:hypothetical protein
MHRLFVQETLKRQRSFGLQPAADLMAILPPRGFMLRLRCTNYAAKFLTIALPAVSLKIKLISIKYLMDSLVVLERALVLQFCCNNARNMKKAPRFHEAP